MRAPTTCLALSPTSFQMPLQEPPQGYAGSLGTRLKPLPRNVEGVADDPALHNPLQRMHRSADVHMPLHASPHPLLAHAAAPACSFLTSSSCSCLLSPPPVHLSSSRHCCLLHQATHCLCSLVPLTASSFASLPTSLDHCLKPARIWPCLTYLWLGRLGPVLAMQQALHLLPVQRAAWCLWLPAPHGLPPGHGSTTTTTLRSCRLGPGWMGVIMEYEGVLVEDTSELHSQAWEQLGREEQKARPLHHALKRSEGMKAEQASTPRQHRLSLGECTNLTALVAAKGACKLNCSVESAFSSLSPWLGLRERKTKPLRKGLHACCLLPA